LQTLYNVTGKNITKNKVSFKHLRRKTLENLHGSASRWNRARWHTFMGQPWRAQNNFRKL